MSTYSRNEIIACTASEARADPSIAQYVVGPTHDGSGLLVRPPAGSDFDVRWEDYIVVDDGDVYSLRKADFDVRFKMRRR